jgi:hypothetical protein
VFVLYSENQLKLSGRRIEFCEFRPGVMYNYNFPLKNTVVETSLCVIQQHIMKTWGSVKINSCIFRCVRKIAKSDYQLRHIRPSAWNNSTPTGRILMKFYI